MIKKVCPICGKEFIAKRKEQVLCSIMCRHKYNDKKQLVTCESCNKKFYKSSKEIKKTKHNFCCKECFDKFQKQENKIIILKNYAKIIINSVKYGTFEVKFDIEDVEKIKNFKWCIRKYNNNFYVQSHILISSKNRKTIQLHRFIMNCPENKVIDHINHDTLDNRKLNLRVCTIAENNQNKVLNINNKSGYRGVFYEDKYNRWIGQIQINKKHYKQNFSTCEEANEWCIKMRKKLMPFANV